MCTHLELPVLPFDIFAIKCKFKRIETIERSKSLVLHLPKNEIITLYKCTETYFWTKSKSHESTEVYCCVGRNTSIFSLKVLLNILEDFTSNSLFLENYIYEIMEEYDDDDIDYLMEICDKIQDGICVNVFTLQKLLRKMIARKRWKQSLCFGRIRRMYQGFVEDYYAPPDGEMSGGKGYAFARDHFNCEVEIVVSNYIPFLFDGTMHYKAEIQVQFFFKIF